MSRIKAGDKGITTGNNIGSNAKPVVAGNKGVFLNGVISQARSPVVGDRCLAYPKQGGGWVLFKSGFTNPTGQLTRTIGGDGSVVYNYEVYSNWVDGAWVRTAYIRKRDPASFETTDLYQITLPTSDDFTYFRNIGGSTDIILMSDGHPSDLHNALMEKRDPDTAEIIVSSTPSWGTVQMFGDAENPYAWVEQTPSSNSGAWLYQLDPDDLSVTSTVYENTGAVASNIICLGDADVAYMMRYYYPSGLTMHIGKYSLPDWTEINTRTESGDPGDHSIWDCYLAICGSDYLIMYNDDSRSYERWDPDDLTYIEEVNIFPD